MYKQRVINKPRPKSMSPSNPHTPLLSLLLLSFFLPSLSLKGQPHDPIDGLKDSIYEPKTACPCDLTPAVCDRNCCCDFDCLYFRGVDEENLEDFFEFCQEGSMLKKEVETRMPICSGEHATREELYNPLYTGFQLFKKGFCIMKENNKKMDDMSVKEDDSKIQKLIEKILEEQENSEKENEENKAIEKLLPNTKTEDEIIIPFESNSNISIPVTLPSGMCLFKGYKVKVLQNKSVQCSYIYKTGISNKIIDSIFIGKEEVQNETKHKIIYDNSYTREKEKSDNPLTKVDIIIYTDSNGSHTSQYNFTYYYENEAIPNGTLHNLFVKVTFLKEKENSTPYSDFIRSGNSGYVKNSNILFGKQYNTQYIQLMKSPGLLIGGDKSGNCVYYKENNNMSDIELFYDSYLHNQLSLEDTIVFGCKKNEFDKNNFLFSVVLNENYAYFSKFGNVNLTGENGGEWVRKDLDGFNPNNLLKIFYKPSGTTNNTQYELRDFESAANFFESDDKFNFFFIKFFGLEPEKYWWYAPGPGLIPFPKNLLYPFRTGTTRYTSNRDNSNNR